MKVNSTLEKTILYRIYSVIIAFGVSYLLTGDIPMASKITIILEFVKLCQYYLFEKIWDSKKTKLYM